MHSVTIDGAIYKKASDLAREFGYTADYIGQLCRANKVDAKLVGRSWYVREDSLNVHKDSRYRSFRSDEITSDDNNISATENEPTVRIVPVMSKKTARMTTDASLKHDQRYLTRVNSFKPATYENDDADLAPNPDVFKSPKRLNVELSNSEKVKIKLISKPETELSFTEVPSVSLRGNIKVKTYEEVEEDATPVVLAKVAKPIPPPQHKKAVSASLPARKAATKVSFTPHIVSETVVVENRGSWQVVAISFTAAVLVAGVLLSLDSYQSYDDTMSTPEIIWNVASLAKLLEFFTF